MPVMTQHKTIQEQVNELKTSNPTLRKVVQTSGKAETYRKECYKSVLLGRTPYLRDAIETINEPNIWVLSELSGGRGGATMYFGQDKGNEDLKYYHLVYWEEVK